MRMTVVIEEKISSVILPGLVKVSRIAWFWSNMAFGNLALVVQQADIALRIFQRVEPMQIAGPEAQLALLSGISLASLRAGNSETATINLMRIQQTAIEESDEAIRSKFEKKSREIGREIGQDLDEKRKKQAWGIATVEDCERNNTLYINKEYTLSAGIGWGDIPASSDALVAEPITLPSIVLVEPLKFDVVVWAEDMDIKPNWIETIEIDRAVPPCLVQFGVVPRSRGKKVIKVDFYYQRYWVQQIQLELNVVKSPSASFKVGMMLGISGLGDQSFNDSAYEGLVRAQQSDDFDFAVANSGTTEETVDCLQHWCETDYDLIIALGHQNATAVAQVAKAFPEHHFAVIDAEVTGNNVWSAVFREYEGDYIAGALAALVTMQNRIGFIGIMQHPVVRRIESAFLKGVRSVDSEIVVIPVYANTFADTTIGRSLAEKLYTIYGVDVIYQAVGRSGIGAIQAAEQLRKLIISTGGDHSDLSPGVILASRIKHMYRPVLDVISEDLSQEFEGGRTMSYGVADDAITLTSISPEVAELLPPGVEPHYLNTCIGEILEAIRSGRVVLEFDEQEEDISGISLLSGKLG